jgi:hypothetical protein
MLPRWTLRLSLFAFCCFFLGSFALSAQGSQDRRGRKYKAPPPTSTIQVTVLRFDDGKPIENAAVIFHPVEGDRDKGAMELKSNEDGKATIDVIPIGDTVRLQIIAKGFQTYGKDYQVDKAQMSMEIKLRRPTRQFSIYENHSDSSGNSNNGSGSSNNGNSQKSAPPSDKPSGSQNPPPNSN